MKRRRAGPGKTAAKTRSLRSDLPQRPLADEIVDILLERRGLRVERIVSTGHVTPDGQWHDQETDEWVLVVEGAARLRIEGEETDRELNEGDWILLPARCRHRVTWTRAAPPPRRSGLPSMSHLPRLRRRLWARA